MERLADLDPMRWIDELHLENRLREPACWRVYPGLRVRGQTQTRSVRRSSAWVWRHCIASRRYAAHELWPYRLRGERPRSQFTSDAFTEAVLGKGIQFSMDGKGNWRDSVFVERLLRSVKYEEVYLKAYDSVTQASQSITAYVTWYDRRRRHSRLTDRTPDDAYFAMLCAVKTAV